MDPLGVAIAGGTWMIYDECISNALTEEAGDLVIPMSELIKDPTYKAFLQTKPKTPKISRDPKWVKTPPWVVYVQREMGGKWGKKEFWKYSDAFKFFRTWMKAGCYDATIHNKRIPFEPPSRLARIRGKFVKGSDGKMRQATKFVYWRVPSALMADQPDHNWCLYCRRPTVFKFYSKHKRLGAVDPTVKRCCICGASERVALSRKERNL